MFPNTTCAWFPLHIWVYLVLKDGVNGIFPLINSPIWDSKMGGEYDWWTATISNKNNSREYYWITIQKMNQKITKNISKIHSSWITRDHWQSSYLCNTKDHIYEHHPENCKISMIWYNDNWSGEEDFLLKVNTFYTKKIKT